LARWQDIVESAPEFAAAVRERLDAHVHKTIATLRRDGSPRISSIDPCLLDGQLYLGMMWRSMKALDLLHDPRTVLRSPICTSNGDEQELTLRGRAVEVKDPEERRRYISVRTSWREPYLHLFALDIESAALIKYGGGQQSALLWPQKRSFTRPYG